MSFRHLLPYKLRRLLPVAPDPRDAEFAGAVLDNGQIDEAWTAAHTRKAGPATILADFPRVTTPESVEASMSFVHAEGAASMRRYLTRKAEHDQRRYPLTVARLRQVSGTARERDTQLDALREREREAGQAAAVAATAQFRSENAAQYEALGVRSGS